MGIPVLLTPHHDNAISQKILSCTLPRTVLIFFTWNQFACSCSLHRSGISESGFFCSASWPWSSSSLTQSSVLCWNWSCITISWWQKSDSLSDTLRKSRLRPHLIIAWAHMERWAVFLYVSRIHHSLQWQTMLVGRLVVGRGAAPWSHFPVASWVICLLGMHPDPLHPLDFPWCICYMFLETFSSNSIWGCADLL